MKKTAALLGLILIASVSGYSQAIVNSISSRVEGELPDSVKYYNPTFANGRVFFNDGGYSNGTLNISAYDQAVQFIDEEGTVRTVGNDASISKVLIGKVMFYKFNNQYVSLVDNCDGVYLGVSKLLEFKTDAKKGAFGTVSETTSITQVNSVSARGHMITLDNVSGMEYTLRSIPYLYSGGKFYAITKNRLLKLFPAKKGMLENYLSEKDPNLNNAEEMWQLFQILKEAE